MSVSVVAPAIDSSQCSLNEERENPSDGKSEEEEEEEEEVDGEKRRSPPSRHCKARHWQVEEHSERSRIQSPSLHSLQYRS